MCNSWRAMLLSVVLLICTGVLFAMPGQDAAIKFSHKFHVQENEVECLTCHSATETSLKGTDNLLPDMETCGQCHEVDDDENCTLCHLSMDNLSTVERVSDYSAKFPHAKHLQKGLNCLDCHAEVAEKTTARERILPLMPKCITCHTTRGVSTTCVTCHEAGDDLRPQSHKQDFLRNHGFVAQNGGVDPLNKQKCANCHQDNFCQDCHEGDNLNNSIHPQNFKFTHSLSAMLKERDCTTCHESRSFCAECHAENHVMPHSHTAGWTNVIPNDGGRHRLEAENDLEYCMTCHEENAQELCATCHEKK